MLRIQCSSERNAVVLTVSGRLVAANVSELRQSLDPIPAGVTVVLDLADLVLADCEAVSQLRTLETREHLRIRNCPSYIRRWMDLPGG